MGEETRKGEERGQETPCRVHPTTKVNKTAQKIHMFKLNMDYGVS